MPTKLGVDAAASRNHAMNSANLLELLHHAHTCKNVKTRTAVIFLRTRYKPIFSLIAIY